MSKNQKNEEGEIRVSCASFAKIECDNKLFLLRHGGNIKKGITMYMPIGGGLFTKPLSQEWLNNKVTKWDKEGELRFRLKKEDLPEFEILFNNKDSREFGVDRETWEELVLEEKLLVFNQNQVEQKYLYTYKTFAEIWGMPFTRYMFDVFEVKLSEQHIKNLKQFVDNNSELIILATPEEILQGRTEKGHIIGNSARALVTKVPLTNYDVNKKIILQKYF